VRRQLEEGWWQGAAAVAVNVQRGSDPSFSGGQLLRPSTSCGGDFFPAARGTAAPPSPRCLGQDLDLIVISSGGSGCSVQISRFFCIFLFLWA
jgi:hypothetical protein